MTLHLRPSDLVAALLRSASVVIQLKTNRGTETHQRQHREGMTISIQATTSAADLFEDAAVAFIITRLLTFHEVFDRRLKYGSVLEKKVKR